MSISTASSSTPTGSGSRHEPVGGIRLIPIYSCDTTPGDTTSVLGDATLHILTPDGGMHPYEPVTTPELGSPVQEEPPPKKSRRSLKLTDSQFYNILCDSGSDVEEGDEIGDEISEGEGEGEEGNDELGNQPLCPAAVRQLCRRLRTEEVERDEVSENERGAPTHLSSLPIISDFSSWSDDFSSFSGQQEEYLRVPGPNFSSQDPSEIFQEIWDHEFVEMIVRETNDYAWQNIAQLSDPDVGTGIPSYLDSWYDVTVGEMYRYFAVLIMMSLCYCSHVSDYWSNSVLGIMGFRRIMARNRFLLIGKFIHFVPSIDLPTRGHDRKIEKIAPVLDHCNRKFAALYTPSQYLSLDESLLLWKGRLSWRQCIRSKAARFGIKSFELCESQTGYVLQYRIYTGKRGDMHPDALHGFQDHTTKVVMDLMEQYLDAGHVLVMDNWYNQLPLTRYLKTRNTDVLGTISRRRKGIPSAIKNLNTKQVKRGTTVARHCGDIALVAWKDVKLVTIMSTYHQQSMVPGRRAGPALLKPVAVAEYNRHMGGVDLKDQKLSMFLMERKKGLKWYLKVFKRLLNCSILNAFIIYSHNPMFRMYTHRNFRFKIVEGLLNRFPSRCPVPSGALDTMQPICVRLQPANHFPVYTEVGSGPRKERRRLRCVRCSGQKRRTQVNTICELCKVPLCLGKCWKEYHTALYLK